MHRYAAMLKGFDRHRGLLTPLDRWSAPSSKHSRTDGSKFHIDLVREVRSVRLATWRLQAKRRRDRCPAQLRRHSELRRHTISRFRLAGSIAEALCDTSCAESQSRAPSRRHRSRRPRLTSTSAWRSWTAARPLRPASGRRFQPQRSISHAGGDLRCRPSGCAVSRRSSGSRARAAPRRSPAWSRSDS